jgi:hypothetical protein
VYGHLKDVLVDAAEQVGTKSSEIDARKKCLSKRLQIESKKSQTWI